MGRCDEREGKEIGNIEWERGGKEIGNIQGEKGRGGYKVGYMGDRVGERGGE